MEEDDGRRTGFFHVSYIDFPGEPMADMARRELALLVFPRLCDGRVYTVKYTSQEVRPTLGRHPREVKLTAVVALAQPDNAEIGEYVVKSGPGKYIWSPTELVSDVGGKLFVEEYDLWKRIR